jgi:hypothetical protein
MGAYGSPPCSTNRWRLPILFERGEAVTAAKRRQPAGQPRTLGLRVFCLELFENLPQGADEVGAFDL